jgi:hypothetical protein
VDRTARRIGEKIGALVLPILAALILVVYYTVMIIGVFVVTGGIPFIFGLPEGPSIGLGTLGAVVACVFRWRTKAGRRFGAR